jgi:DNA-binding MarR family transcriptional regulator
MSTAPLATVTTWATTVRPLDAVQPGRCPRILASPNRLPPSPLPLENNRRSLQKGPIDQITLGGHTALDRNTVAVVVRKLEERGLVTRQRNPQDRRAMLVTLTKEGERLRHAAEPSVAEVQEEILAPLEEDERETLCRLLARIAEENNHLSRVPMRRAG